MAMATQERGRITARVPAVLVEKLQEAADLSGATLNQFVVQAALEKAEKVIDKEHALRFSAEDAAMFIDMLDNPRPPNNAMARAYERYKAKLANGIIRNSVVAGA
ncbi:hypothetical protein GCM10027277_52530 [Pseudoduganella ginsengisoli]|uniref:DUF1778 domain-containing protein n=1 Tax=Pseudoduganella ginsengisoli TaxID=1462440 RepID=A0A6L6Q5B6_9BURK|nr:DUF1778 domain-containing protein [Pseudoduganella ginsengisoli]MTW04468.1 DUF1778 domain-containing protein [Pseudoduganella ginsengisoli]